MPVTCVLACISQRTCRWPSRDLLGRNMLMNSECLRPSASGRKWPSRSTWRQHQSRSLPPIITSSPINARPLPNVRRMAYWRHITVKFADSQWGDAVLLQRCPHFTPLLFHMPTVTTLNKMKIYLKDYISPHALSQLAFTFRFSVPSTKTSHLPFPTIFQS